ncbi:uroporphyrinogen-III synthase [Thalassococcus sp. BH17M4-6]
MTRPADRSEAFVTALRAEVGTGFASVVSPLIGLQTTGPLPDMGAMRGVIFTSASAVDAFRALGGTPLDPCFVVGAATAAAARSAGFEPVSADGDVEDLIALIMARSTAGPLMHLRGAHSRGELAKRLSSAGIETHEAVIYDQPLLSLTAEAAAALDGPGPVIVPLFSPRTAARFAESAPRLTSAWIVAMSGAVAETLAQTPPIRLCVAARPTGSEMLKMVAMLMDEARTLESGRGAQ